MSLATITKWSAAAVAVGVIALAIVRTASSSDGTSAAPPVVVQQPSSTTTTPSGSGDCDAHAVHMQMGMWNPDLADEMLALGCPWPYEQDFRSLAGGKEDPSIAAPFAPIPYATVFAMINAGNFGLCQMASMAQDHTAGVVEGFTLRMAEPRCPNGQPTEQVVLREYATRALRDAAAHAHGGSLVLGRWVVEVSGSNDAGVQQLHSGLVRLGAFDTPA